MPESFGTIQPQPLMNSPDSKNEISQQILVDLKQLLANLAIDDNTIRSEAELLLNNEWLSNRPDAIIAGLSKLLIVHEDDNMKMLAAVLLRRICLKTIPKPENETGNNENGKTDITYWMNIGSSARSFTENNLLIALANSSNSPSTKKIADAISELSKHIISKGGAWPELVTAVISCTKSADCLQRELAYRIIASTPLLFTHTDLNQVKHLLGAALHDEYFHVAAAAIKATVYFIIAINESSDRDLFTELIREIVYILSRHITNQEDFVEESISYLIELAEIFPKMFKTSLPTLCPFMIEVMKSKDMEPATRHSALEILLTLTEAAPGMIRKFGNLHTALIPIVLEWISDLDDDPEWYTADDINDDDNEANNIIGEQALDRIARALGGKTVLPTAFVMIPRLLGSIESWQHRHAGLIAVYAIAEGCQKIMEAELDKVIALVVPFLRDTHPRVRHAACSAIGQMGTDFSPRIQEIFSKEILTNLIPIMDDVNNPRVQCHAAAALVNFTEVIEKEALLPYLETIMGKLISLLNTGKIFMQEQALTSIATVADRSEDGFIKFYPATMPLLISILQTATADEVKKLRGKTMECASLIALAVGKEVFLPDAEVLLNIFRNIQESITQPDDPQSPFLLAAWARVCKVLGSDFTPYLDYVMGSLLASASLKPDFALIDPDEDNVAEAYAAEDGWQLISSNGGQMIGIKTAVLDEKLTALEMLSCYARELGGNFHPYVDKVMSLVVPLFKFYFDSGIRSAAVTVVPYLFASLVEAHYDKGKVVAVWHGVAEKLIDSINTEIEPSFVSLFFTTFHECLAALGSMSLTSDLLAQVSASAVDQLKEFSLRINDRNASRNAVDHDGEDEELLLEEQYSDETVIGELSRVFHEVFKNHGSTYLVHFEILLPVVSLFAGNADSTARQWAVCVLADMIEFCGPACFAYQSIILDVLNRTLLDPVPDVRQPACYAFGVLAAYGGEQFASSCIGTLPSLFLIINAEESKDDENLTTTDNAISAVGKICHYLGGQFDSAPVLDAWVASLPIVHDAQEAPHTYTFFMDLLEKGHPCAVKNLPKTLNILVTALTQEFFLDDTVPENPNTLKRVLDCFNKVRGQMENGGRNALAPWEIDFLQGRNWI